MEFDYKPIIIALFVGFGVLEVLTGRFVEKGKIRRDDIWIEAIGTGVFILIAAPLIFAARLACKYRLVLCYYFIAMFLSVSNKNSFQRSALIYRM
jgi:hypothetical protein